MQWCSYIAHWIVALLQEESIWEKQNQYFLLSEAEESRVCFS